jgi:predicted DCC family thiol-disulfide oxidoreductase YuxK
VNFYLRIEMPRVKGDTEWVSASEAGRRLGLTAQAIGIWGAKPEAPVKLERAKLLYEWPKFPRWREALIKADREKPLDLAEAQKRRATAEAEIAEMERDKMREDLVPRDDVRLVWRQGMTTIRAQLLAVPGRYAARTVGLASLPESQRAWDHAVRDILAELQEG